MRVGYGYDSHRFAPGRRLVLGGVGIPGSPGLKGHSDADVLIHALIDALLGAAALGDIGQHFPDTDPAYENADSMELLERVNALLGKEGWRIGNVDATVLCQNVRLAPHIPAVRASLARRLGLDVSLVSVKAKTNEGLDAVGRGEAVAAQVVVLITKEGS